MYQKIGSGKVGTGLVAVVAILALPLVSAETVITVNGKAIDSEVLEIYMAGRSQKPVEQLTPTERTALTDELTDVYVLSTLDLASELEKDPGVAAQLDLQRATVLARAVVASLAEDIDVTEEEIQAVYLEQIKLAPREQYKARHILVESQGEAIAIIQELIGGADFQALAKERSTGPSGPNGGDLDWFMPDQMVKPFSDAVARLENGRYTTDPVQTQFGWHVILREGSRAAEPPTLEGVRDAVATRVQQDKLRAKIDELRANAVK